MHAIRSSSNRYRGARAALLASEPGVFAVESSEVYRVAVHTGAPHHLWGWQNGQRHDGPHARGEASVTAVGESRRVRWDRPTAFVSIELAPSLVREVAAGMDIDLSRAKVIGSFSRRDPVLENLAFALVRELDTDLENGALFGEAVATAMAARLVREYSARPSPARERRGGLAPRTLKSVVEYMHASLAQPVALADLAKVANLSAFHFGRAFQHSTGIPPHAYVIRARVGEAIRLILGGVRVSDAAASVGFSSQGHLTRHMRRVMGITPGTLVPRRRGSARSPRAQWNSSG